MKESYDCDCGVCSICNGLRKPGESHKDAALRMERRVGMGHNSGIMATPKPCAKCKSNGNGGCFDTDCIYHGYVNHFEPRTAS